MKNEIGNNFPIYLEGENIYLTPFTRDHLEMKDSWLWLDNLDTTKIGKNAKTKIIRGGYI